MCFFPKEDFIIFLSQKVFIVQEMNQFALTLLKSWLEFLIQRYLSEKKYINLHSINLMWHGSL